MKPRYRTLFEEFEQNIASGHYPVGELLPPEVELCRQFGVSRHTMRDALRLLSEAGLVERRRGSGTTVLSQKPRPTFVQPLGGLDEILQYAHNARMSVRRSERRSLTSAERRRIRTEDGEDWWVVEALRIASGEAIALSEIYIRGDFTNVIDQLDGWDGAVLELIARDYGTQVQLIEQEISAETLGTSAAKILGSEAGVGVLQTLRRYYDEAGKVMLASDSVNARSRVIYAMSYRREG